MNKLLLIALAALMLPLTGCEDSETSRQEEKAKPTFMFWCFRQEIVSSDYHVPAMTTPEAAAYLQHVVKGMPGHVSSSYDLPRKTFTVKYNSSTVRMMNFEETIALAGFDVNGRPANAQAKAKLMEAN